MQKGKFSSNKHNKIYIQNPVMVHRVIIHKELHDLKRCALLII